MRNKNLSKTRFRLSLMHCWSVPRKPITYCIMSCPAKHPTVKLTAPLRALSSIPHPPSPLPPLAPGTSARIAQ